MYVAIENKIDNFVGISCQIHIEFAGGGGRCPHHVDGFCAEKPDLEQRVV
jgi:hypothetical protein